MADTETKKVTNLYGLKEGERVLGEFGRGEQPSAQELVKPEDRFLSLQQLRARNADGSLKEGNRVVVIGRMTFRR